MSISNRAFRVAFAALMLTLASQAGAVGQSVVEASQVKAIPLAAATTAPSESQQRINKSKSNIKNNRTATGAPISEVPTTAGQPADGKVNGKVTTSQGTGMLGKAAPVASDTACATQPKGSAPRACPKGINQAGIK